MALAFVAVLIAGTSLIYWRAGLTKREAAVAAEPIPVATSRLEAAGGYSVVDRLVGQLEPLQTARLAFERGGLFTSIAVAATIMLIVSLLLALTVTPALAGFLLGGSRSAGVGLLDRGIVLPRFGRWFERLIDLALAHKQLAILGAMALPLMDFLSFPTLTAQLFPGRRF